MKSILMFLLFLVLLGCATSPRDKWTGEIKKVTIPTIIKININSEPLEAKVYLDDAPKGITPYVLEIRTQVTKEWIENYHWRDGALIEIERKGHHRGGEGWGFQGFTLYFQEIHPIKVVVFKEGYKRQEKYFDTERLYSQTERHWRDEINVWSFEINWTAFLEKEEKPFRLPVEVYPPSK